MMIEKEIYVTDGELKLVKMTAKEKDNYMRLLKQSSESKHIYENEDESNMVWRIMQGLGDLDYSIYNGEWEYCGNISLKHHEETTPEIGIDLLEEMQNKGIGPKCIKMFARKIYEEREDVEYFIIRVASTNAHSKYVMEKLGAINIGVEESLLRKALNSMQELYGAEMYNKVKSDIDMDIEKEADEEFVYRYKLLPEAFL